MTSVGQELLQFLLKTLQISEHFWLSKHLPYKGDCCGYLKAEQASIVTQSAQPIELEKHIYASNSFESESAPNKFEPAGSNLKRLMRLFPSADGYVLL